MNKDAAKNFAFKQRNIHVPIAGGAHPCAPGFSSIQCVFINTF